MEKQTLLEQRLAQVLAITKKSFDAAMIADRIAVAVNVGSNEYLAWYISTDDFARLAANGALLTTSQFTTKYGSLLHTKVLYNYEKVVNFILENSAVAGKSRRTPLSPAEK